MHLTRRLLSRLHRIFDTDPASFVAFRLTGTWAWRVADGTMTVWDPAGLTRLEIDLTTRTLLELSTLLAAQPGIDVSALCGAPERNLTAAVLLEGEGTLTAIPVPIQAYSSTLWALLEAWAAELRVAQSQVVEALKQISLAEASAEWVDEHGQYYGIARAPGEADERYAPRILAEVLAPRGNNVAMEAAIGRMIGQPVTVQDVVVWGAPSPAHNGAAKHNAAVKYDASAAPVYGLFDVVAGYDLLGGGSPSALVETIEGVVERLRDAGTQLRGVTLGGSTLADSARHPTDPTLSATVGLVLSDPAALPSDAAPLGLALGVPSMADTASHPVDEEVVQYVFTTTYSGARRYDGAIMHGGGFVLSGLLDGTITASMAAGGAGDSATLGKATLGGMKLGAP